MIDLRNEESLETKGRRGSDKVEVIPPMVESPRATMAHNLERPEHPLNPPINLLV